MLIVNRSAVWERQVLETAEGVPFREDAVTILEFDDAGLILRYRSYYDKLRIRDRITSGMSGIYGWFANKRGGSPCSSSATTSLWVRRAWTRLRPDH